MKGHLLMMKKKELALLSLKMEWCIQEVGIMANKMEKDF